MAELVQGPTEADVLKLVTVDQLKEQKRITSNRERNLLQDCILDAWSFIDGPEGFCRRAILPQKWAVALGAWPAARALRIPVSGARTVTRITAIGADGAGPVEMQASAYSSFTPNGIDCTLRLPAALALPILADRPDALRIEVDAGYDAVEKVPRVFRRSLLLLAAHYYDNREEAQLDNRVNQVSRKIENGMEALLHKYIVPIDHGGQL